ncbi:MAG: virulence factor SrfB [Sphingobacteriales bacterium]|nr:MAG: virulence factor SrfB [Sphingobacteriales bacterium]
MDKLQLIANSGIQFYKFNFSINLNERLIPNIGFYEFFDPENIIVGLEFAIHLADFECWVSKKKLAEDGYIIDGEVLIDLIDISTLPTLDEETDCYSINEVNTALTHFENKWLPIPYFEQDDADNFQFGPINWCRLKLIPKNSINKNKSYEAILVFDTSTDNDKEGPLLEETHKKYGLCKDLDLLLNYTNDKYNCEWVRNYIAKLIYGNEDKVPTDFPSTKYIGWYIYFIKYLSESGKIPGVELYPNDLSNSIDVDLILDIGNSNTCGVLFEHPRDDRTFEFNNVKRLIIQDLSNAELSYDSPFSMRLVFHKCNFGDIGEMGYGSSRFQWPSFIRIGEEAHRLIYHSTNAISVDAAELVTNHSSPKRYLWDTECVNSQWELIKTGDIDTDLDSSLWIEGISQQFAKDGSFSKATGFGNSNNFSRRSLMTFVFIEIFIHALSQINSHEFKFAHGNVTVARRLRRVVITCPTGMVLEEQIRLRESAHFAAIALSRYYSKTFNLEYKEEDDKQKIEIIPSIKDLKKGDQNADTKRDWMYDEATCSQLVFIYAEIAKRYLNDCNRFFNLYGKYRRDLPNYEKKSITIGSIDIGGGTTDLMICSYMYGDGGTAVITPYPLYWESFNLAGDDLLKEVIQQIIIEGRIENEKFRGCTGVIQNYALEKGVENIERKLNSFFGLDTWNVMDSTSKQIRHVFNTQIAIPVAEKYLEHAQQNLEDTIYTYEMFFPVNKPNKDLLIAFESHFGFKFEDIRWKLSSQRVHDIVERKFEPLIKQLSILLHAMRCDFILLAGRPTKFTIIQDLFLKFYPVSPDKIISLSNYWVGRWYPFQDQNGYFENKDSKSLVAVGAAISLLGGRLDLLNNFRINLDLMKTTLTSTAEYFGVFNRQLNRVDDIFLSPDVNRKIILIHSLPTTFGFKRLLAEFYPSRPIYLLELNWEEIKKFVVSKNPNFEDNRKKEEVEKYIINLKNRMPYRVSLSREYHDNKEILKIESIEDKEGNLIQKSFIKLKIKTIVEDEGYWLDSGEFLLKVEAR